MPDKTDYRLVFKGKTVAGHSVQKVKQNLAARLNLDPEKIDPLFSGRRIIIKRHAELQTANQFKAAFKRAGAVLKIEAIEPPELQTPESEPAAALPLENHEPDFLHPPPAGRKAVIASTVVIFGFFLIALLGIGGYLAWQEWGMPSTEKRAGDRVNVSKKADSEKWVSGLPFVEKSGPVTSEEEFNRVIERINRLQAQAVGYLKEGNYQKVALIYEEVLETVISKFGKDHMAVPGAMNDLAFALVKQAKFIRAEVLYLEVIKACHAAGNKEDLQVAVASEELARIYLKQGRLNEIDPLYRQAIRVWDRISGPENASSLDLKRKRVALLKKLGRENESDRVRKDVDNAQKSLKKKSLSQDQTALSTAGIRAKTGSGPVAAGTNSSISNVERITLSVSVDFGPVTMEIAAKSGRQSKLTEKPPKEIIKKPDFKGTRQRYGKLTLGTQPDKTYCFVLDIQTDGSPVLYFDKNRNGNLADDGPPLKNKGSGVFATTVSIPIRRLIKEYDRKANFNIWIYTKNWPEPTFHHYSRTQMKGRVYLNGKTYLAYIAERDLNDADFTNDGLYLDIDQNDKIDSQTEWIGPGEKIVIDGKAYRFDVQW